MFARVITGLAPDRDLLETLSLLAREQLPVARTAPGFAGYWMLTNPMTGEVMVVSLWRTREQMDAVTSVGGNSGIRDSTGIGMNDLTLAVFDVPVFEVATATSETSEDDATRKPENG